MALFAPSSYVQNHVGGNTHAGSKRSYVFSVGVFLLVGSVALNVVLARKVNTLLALKRTAAANQLLNVGTKVPPITAKRADGRIETITYSNSLRPTVLYIFTPTCSWCERNLNNIKTLIELKRGEYSFVGLSLSANGLPSYLSARDLSLTTYTDISADVIQTYKLRATPQTIVISPEGRVIQNWMGAYVGAQKSQIETFFRVTLPGIPPPTKPTDLQNDLPR